jgi:Holliday junction resolvase RusA-like endonuclease
MAIIKIPGRPVPKKNSMMARCVNGKPLIIQSKNYREYEKMALLSLADYQGPRFNCPVQVKASYWLADNRRPDLNNLMAATADILEKAGILKNDRDIVSWDGSRIMGVSPEPRTEIVITSIDNKLYD